MGGKADTGLGERDDDEDEEEEDIGHSRGFMSWRLRQKVATCSVLCKRTDRDQCPDTEGSFQNWNPNVHV